MGYRHGFVIEYVPKEGKGVDCRNCIHADMDDKSCSVKPILFSEHGYGQWKHCKSFKIYNVTEGPIKMKQKEKKKKPITLAEIEKELKKERKREKELRNRTIISVANELHYFDDENSIVDSIKAGPRIIISDDILQDDICKCGGQLVKEKSVKLNLVIKGTQVYIFIPCKRCKNCKKRYVDRKQVIDQIRNIRMD